MIAVKITFARVAGQQEEASLTFEFRESHMELAKTLVRVRSKSEEAVDALAEDLCQVEQYAMSYRDLEETPEEGMHEKSVSFSRSEPRRVVGVFLAGKKITLEEYVILKDKADEFYAALGVKHRGPACF